MAGMCAVYRSVRLLCRSSTACKRNISTDINKDTDCSREKTEQIDAKITTDNKDVPVTCGSAKVPDNGSKSLDDNNVQFTSYRLPPEPPVGCCMSGCANCVWIAYADELAAYYKDGGAKAEKEIREHITDPTVREFVLMELSTR